MHLVGIDYSMTSPSMCSWRGDPTTREPAWEDCESVFITAKKSLVGRKGNIVGVPMHDWTTQEERFDALSRVFMCGIDGDTRVLMEGYAMGARGLVFHIGECAGVLKNKIWSSGASLETAAPSEIKKHATGKGNADKDAMVEAFRAKTGVDLREVFGKKTSASPVSDVADAFFALTLLVKRVRESRLTPA